jgi:uncharacterized protein (TIGR02266 family)
MATNTPKKNRTDETVALQKLSDGLTKHEQTITQLVIAGVVMPTKDVIAKLQVRIQQANAAQSTKATWQAAVKDDKVSGVASKTFVSALKQTLLAAYAGQVDTLADFGLTPRKPLVMTPEKRAAAAAKAKATRAARHTMGKKQKALVKGTSPVAPATTPVPVPVPATTPALTPAPAPAPTSSPPSQRRAERLPVELEVSLFSDSNFYVGFTENLSESGVFVATYFVRPLGSRVEMCVRIHGRVEPLILRGEVRWIREFSPTSDGCPGMGIQFDAVSDDDRAEIATFLSTRDPLFFA